MRTTLAIDDDVLQAAKEIAARERKTAGEVISELARRGIHSPELAKRGSPGGRVRNGIRMLPRRGEIVTLEKVRRIMDDEGI